MRVREIKYHSTNYNTTDVDFKTAVLIGQALDKGLYMLNSIPKISQETINDFKNLTLQEIALITISKIIGNAISYDDLKNIITKALNFEIITEKIDENDYICYLDRGPTCSFKDYGVRMLSRIMEHFLTIEGKNVLILTATSGDTGGAVAQAFHKMNKIKVIVLYPKEEISDLQRKQMTTLGDNIIAIGINGKFDDCQKMIKKAFADKDLLRFNLSSANSINIGRLIPQIVYYFWSYSRIIETKEEKILFSVPSGNFGNLTGGLIAFKMGLPVIKFISAVNENDEFPKFLKSGVYRKIDPSKKCLSSAMNVGDPSNLARLIDFYEGQINENGIIQKKPDMDKIRSEIVSYSISDYLTRKTIIQFYNDYKKVIEPHGAVGWAALQIYRKRYPSHNQFKSITFETAHPAKFPDEIISLININPELPKSLKTLQYKDEISNPVEIKGYQDLKLFIQKNI
ncbi:MAG: threonine synthase [Candidatus Hodarchaeota archaeon]